MTAWEILTGNSLAPIESTAWIHLNNQDGSGAGSTQVIIGALLTANVNLALEADVGEVLNSNLLMDTLTANIVEDLSSEATINLEADI